MDVRALLCVYLTFASVGTFAELKDLSEDELSGVSGEGIGLVYEDYQFNAISAELETDPNAETVSFKLTGINDQDGNPVDVSLSQMYIAGPNTNRGQDLEGKVVNIGRLNNPYTIDMLDGNDLGGGGLQDKAVLAIAAPTHVAQSEGYHCTDKSQTSAGSGTCASRPEIGSYHGERMDIGLRINTEYVDASKNTNLNFHAESAHFDGSYLRFWGGEADVDGEDGSGGAVSTMMMEARLNVYADKLILNSHKAGCDFTTEDCGHDISFDQFSLELALGDAKYHQPMTFDVTSDGHFKFIIHKTPAPNDSRLPSNSGDGRSGIGADGLIGTSDAATWNWYNDYYTNGAKSNVYIGELRVGGESFGTSTIEGLQIQYLEITSHDL